MHRIVTRRTITSLYPHGYRNCYRAGGKVAAAACRHCLSYCSSRLHCYQNSAVQKSINEALYLARMINMKGVQGAIRPVAVQK